MVWRRRWTVAAFVLTLVFLVAGVGFAFLAATAGAVAILVVGLVVAPTSAGLGMLIVRRRPTNLVGPLLVLVGLAVSFNVTKEIGWRVLVERPHALASLDWLVASLNESAWWAFTAVALLLVYFPDGTLPTKRWRWVPPTLIACTAIAEVQGLSEALPPPFHHHPAVFGPAPVWFQALSLVAFLLQLVLNVACAASLGVRFRRADAVRRTQIKWLALAGVAVPLYPLVCLAEIAIWGRPLWFSATVVAGAAVGIPVATAIAVLRHDLYDVDKALAGTATWMLFSALLFAVYAATALAGGLVLDRGSTAVAAAVTALCAMSLSPVRLRLQRRVDRRLYPLRRAALAAMEVLHRSTSTGEAQPEELEVVLRAALRDPGLRVGFDVPGREGFVDAQGEAVEPAAGGAPITLGGVQIGVLVPGPDGDASPELLRQVGEAAATLAEVVRLRIELTGALREVESSRARLMQLGYEERRRLERDLHDGAQQRLVSLGMALRVAQRHLGDGTVEVDGLLDQSVAELGLAVAELRHIAHGLRPSSLDDGLRAALAGLVRAVPIEVDMDVRVDSLPDDVATTAYYVVSEAVTNTVKHADASRISVQVSNGDGHVLVLVSDDGRGGAALPPKSGLNDRVAALRGTLQVDSPDGQGTIVQARIPCES